MRRSSEEEALVLTGPRSEPCSLSKHPETTWDFIACAPRGAWFTVGHRWFLGTP